MAIIQILNSAVSSGFAIVFAITMLFYGGRANINYYNEGWIECVFLFIIGILGFYNVWRNRWPVNVERQSQGRK